MIKSMTGFGSAEGRVDEITYDVEIKTVNNRYFKAHIRLPDVAGFLSSEVEKLLHRELGRGSINYTLWVRQAGDKLLNIDEIALVGYVNKLRQVSKSAGIEERIELAGLLALPGIIQPALPDEDKKELLRKGILEVTEKALSQLTQMRIAEGAALAEDLRSCCLAASQLLDKVEERKEIVVVEYQKKLQMRVDSLLAASESSLDSETLAREVAVFAERSDISEEITRLRSHIVQFTEALDKDGQAGKRLDFLSQEMLREANTIGSKASDVTISHCVVDIKCQIDRIKEQVQNVE
ncbi:MAG: YicC family protein [Phycisphaerae bacterium]|nr:YicC family protein [Phycisphaerae bacterium]